MPLSPKYILVNSCGFLQEWSHSSGLLCRCIPVDSGAIPLDSGAIPVDSSGMAPFLQESVGQGKVLANIGCKGRSAAVAVI
jgi:hypothetical protein